MAFFTNKKFLSSILRTIVSISLVTWVISRVNLYDLITNFRTIKVSIFVLALIIWQLGVLQRTWRWQILLRGAGFVIPFKKLIALNYHALFFNIFLPTGFGGEIVRIITIEQEANMPRGKVGGLTILD